MKSKNKRILIAIIAIAIILGSIIIIFIKNIKEDNNELNNLMEKITISNNRLEDNIEAYNQNREKLSSLLDNYYLEMLSNDYDQYINILKEQQNIITSIYANIEELATNCQDKLFSKPEIINICNNYEIYYETVVNIYINDEKQINNMIENYNQDTATPLDKYNSTNLTDYIDYNKDGKYLERED